MTSFTMIEAARSASLRGRPLFPCRPNEKRPITLNGLNDASSDPAQIWRWWCATPDANIAMPTGPRSGFVVIDVDVKRGIDGFATLAGLEGDLGALPRTTTVSTPSGGEHRYFRAPLDVVIRNSAGRLAGEDAPGFDVRGEGGYVLIPPSIVDGARYRVIGAAPAAALPARWIEALSAPKRAEPPTAPWEPASASERSRVAAWCSRALRDEARELAAAREGIRSDRLWRAAAALGGLVHTGAIEAADVRRALSWACAQWRTRSPRKDHDTLERGLAFGIANPRRLELEKHHAA